MSDFLVISGVVSITDVCCSIDYPGLPEITYNVTRLERDAFNGRFGAPDEGRFDQLFRDEVDPWRFADRAKVAQFAAADHVIVTRSDWARPGNLRRYRLLDIPTIAVMLNVGGTPGVMPVDGTHRMLAREMLGLKTFSRFIVSAKLEGEYRVRFTEM